LFPYIEINGAYSTTQPFTRLRQRRQQNCWREYIVANRNAEISGKLKPGRWVRERWTYGWIGRNISLDHSAGADNTGMPGETPVFFGW